MITPSLSIVSQLSLFFCLLSIIPCFKYHFIFSFDLIFLGSAAIYYLVSTGEGIAKIETHFKYFFDLFNLMLHCCSDVGACSQCFFVTRAWTCLFNLML